MNKNRIYIDTDCKTIDVELPDYGEIVLIVKNGKVVLYEVKTTNKID
ncbi:hypothetical protein [Enterococcus asini]|nr:hypothetical protein [Enterococcus asini]MCD5030178.1 hypothetical protein [Enterococcus asini]